MDQSDIVLIMMALAAGMYWLWYEIYFFGKLWRYGAEPGRFMPPMSVIVAAKDEAEHLKEYIPLWLEQDYPAFELVIINDRSVDETEEILRRWEHHPQVKIVHIPFQEWKTFIGNKKYALTMGIKAARYDHLLFTDADCRPASDRWIRYMASRFEGGKEIVLGYGKYERRKGWLNLLVRYETLLTGMQYLGFALRKIPYMGVGRNLAYTKELFFRNDGFKNHFEILSGDDDLFVNENATPENTAVCIRPEAHTVSEPPAEWKQWFRQKVRHYSTARYYRFKHRFLLGLYALTRWLVWLLPLYMLLFRPGIRWWGAGMVFVWLSLHTALVYAVGRKLKDPLPLPFIFILEIMTLTFQSIVFVYGLFKKDIQWH